MNDDCNETGIIEQDDVDSGRRKALRRLGLGLSAAYALPVLMTLTRSAAARRPADAASP